MRGHAACTSLGFGRIPYQIEAAQIQSLSAKRVILPFDERIGVLLLIGGRSMSAPFDHSIVVFSMETRNRHHGLSSVGVSLF